MNKNDCIIRLATPSDYKATEYLTREAFWNVYRPGCTEHYVCTACEIAKNITRCLILLWKSTAKLWGMLSIFLR